MSECCKADVMEELQGNVGAKFVVEEAIIDAAVKAITMFHKVLR